MLKKQRKTN